MKKFDTYPEDMAEPVARITNSWTRLQQGWALNRQAIDMLIGQTNADVVRGRLPVRTFAVEAERRLQEGFPDLADSLHDFRTSVTHLDGQFVSWWHVTDAKLAAKPDAEFVEALIDGNALTEGGVAYCRDGGFIKGSEIGFSSVFLTMGYWIDITPFAEPGQGIRQDFSLMYGIEIIPVASSS